MNIENRAVKLYIKELPPSVAIDLFEQYKIPSPYREILTIVCVERVVGRYKAMSILAERYKIYIDYWTFGRRLKDALEMFRKSHKNTCI